MPPWLAAIDVNVVVVIGAVRADDVAKISVGAHHAVGNAASARVRLRAMGQRAKLDAERVELAAAVIDVIRSSSVQLQGLPAMTYVRPVLAPFSGCVAAVMRKSIAPSPLTSPMPAAS